MKKETGMQICKTRRRNLMKKIGFTMVEMLVTAVIILSLAVLVGGYVIYRLTGIKDGAKEVTEDSPVGEVLNNRIIPALTGEKQKEQR